MLWSGIFTQNRSSNKSIVVRKNFFLLLFIIFSLYADAQVNPWNGKKAAVVLTYDDALNVHLDNAVPILDSLGLKGSFYLSAYFPGCRDRISDWRKISANGHELGNHTLFHPCLGNQPGRQWVKAGQDMSKYTVQRMIDETRMTNVFLEAVDGKKKRTFAYTCGDMKIGDSFFIDKMTNDFVAARAVREQMHTIDQVKLLDVDCYAINGQSGDQMIELVKKAMQANTLLVFLFHGVGGEHSLNVSLPAHRQLLEFLKANEKDIWVAPMIEVAEYIKKTQSQKK